jgi:chromosome segregation protein
MRITELEMLGFKSFPQKTQFRFNAGEITGIVGPNGSGKSNIVDAIRWVLGEQRATALRSDKMENVIFNGGEKKKALGMAEVTLKIDNDKGLLGADFREVAVTRRLFRDGESQYFINGSKCRLKDINDLFMDSGIGPDAYSVIELKMIDTILSQNRNERRMLFEEAAGVTKYKKSRASALRKLETTREDLTRLNDIIAEVEKMVRSLARQVGKARRYRDLTAQLQQLDMRKAQIHYHQLLAENRPRREELEAMQRSHSATSTQLSLDEELLQKYRAEIVRLEGRLKQERETLRQLEAEIAAREKEQIAAGEREAANQRSIKNFKDEIKELRNKIGADKHKADDSGQKRDELELELTSAKNAFANADREWQQAREQLSRVQEQLLGWESKAKAARQRLQETQSAAEMLNYKRSETERQIGEMHQQSEQLQAKIGQQRKDLQALRDQEAQERAQLEHLVKEEGKLQEYLQAIDKDLAAAQSESIECRSAFLDIQHRHAFFQDVVRNYSGFSETVKKAMQKQAEIPGLLGPLANLIRVDEGHELALETALGDWANILIVDNSTAEQQLRQLLGEKQSAFILNTEDLRHYRHLTFARTYEPQMAEENSFTGYLIDKIEILNSAIAPLVKALLSNVILAINRDLAKELWRRHPEHMVIAADTTVMYSHGTMRTGKRETSRITGREFQLDKLTRSLAAAETMLKKAEQGHTEKRNLRTRGQDEMQELQLSILRQRDAVGILREQSISLETELRESGGRIERLQDQDRLYREELAEIEAKWASLAPDLETLAAASREAEKEYDGMRGQLAEVRESNNLIAERTNEARVQLVQSQSELSQYLQQLEVAEKQRQELENSLAQKQHALGDAEQESDESSRQRMQREQQLIEQWQERDQLATKLRQGETELDDFKNKAQRAEDELQKFRQANDLFREKRQQLELKIQDAEIRAATIVEQIREQYGLELSENEPPGQASLEQTLLELEDVKRRLGALGDVNPLAVETHERENERLQFLLGQRGDLLTAESKLLGTIGEINSTAREQFSRVFTEINTNFQRVFCEFFENGDGELKLEEGSDPLEANIEVLVRPKGRRPVTIALMSAGEKSLTAISLLFAIYLSKPSPFCIFDEVDAPLDDINIGRFSRAIRKFGDDTQFIIVTHNKRTMEILDNIYGVTQEEAGVSKIVSVDFKSMKLN